MERPRLMTKHDKRMWEILHKPKILEYQVPNAPLPEMVMHDEKKEAGVGLFLLGMLFSILDLPEMPESAIERAGNTNAPEFTPQNEDSEA
jgi:hypothetical protein